MCLLSSLFESIRRSRGQMFPPGSSVQGFCSGCSGVGGAQGPGSPRDVAAVAPQLPRGLALGTAARRPSGVPALQKAQHVCS